MHEHTDFINIRDVSVALAVKVPTKLVSISAMFMSNEKHNITNLNFFH